MRPARKLHVWDVADPSPLFVCGRMPVQGKDGALLYVSSMHVSASRLRSVAPHACKRCMTRLRTRLRRLSPRSPSRDPAKRRG